MTEPNCSVELKEGMRPEPVPEPEPVVIVEPPKEEQEEKKEYVIQYANRRNC